MNEEILRKYYTSHKNMLKVLKYRGFSENVVDQHSLSEEEFNNTYGIYDINDMKNSMSEGLTFKQKNKPTTIIVWITDPKLGANIADINSQLENDAASSALIIADEGTTPQAKETIRNLKTTKKIFIDVWTLWESMVFVPDHCFVPFHRICSVKEKKAVLATYGLQDGKKIPCLLPTDVMTKFLGATKGNLVYILRPSETDPDKFIPTYRMVY